jgi:hypothetical protein
MSASNTSTFNLRTILVKEKLNGMNFIDWYRNLRSILRQDKKEYVLEQQYPDDLLDGATVVPIAYEKHCNDSLNVSCLMLATMSPDLQKQYQHADAHSMIERLHGMFENQARTGRYNISKSLFACKLAEGSPVSPHVIKMIGYIETLEKLGFELKPDLAIDAILQSLPASYEPFIINFQMNGMEETLAELHGILKIAEESIKKNLIHVMVVQKKNKTRKHGTPPKGKAKGKILNEPSSSKQKPKVKSSPTPNDECFHCYAKRHWSRNRKKYFKDLKKKKGSETSALGINVINIIEINIAISSSESLVFDTGSVIHICKSLQGLQRTRKFARGELDVHVGNGAKVAVMAVGTYHLSLSSGLVLELNNYYCIPALSKNIISSSCFEEVDGYEIVIKNKRCSIYYNDILYAHCPLVNGLYILDLEVSLFITLMQKRLRPNDLNPTIIWHCRLGHINEKCIEKLHNDGLLSSFDFESFDTCESCLLGKMTKMPFTGQSERVSDLLGLVHTDVCGPMSSVARGGF